MTEGPSINVDEFRHRPVNEIAAILPNKEAVKARQTKEPPRLLGGSLDLCLLAPVLDLLRSRSWASTNGADRASVRTVLLRDSVAVWTERPLSVLYLRTRRRSVNRIGRRVLEECEYGDDPAVDRRSRDAELGEDRVDVLLHCGLGKE